jgi:hypothetical protein
MSKYVPPHQRRQISDDSEVVDSGSRASYSLRQGQSRYRNLDQDSRVLLQGSIRRGPSRDIGLKGENNQGPSITRNLRQSHDPGEVYTLFDIERYFYPEEGAGEGADRAGTLHGSSKLPDGLAFVILFHQQNPQWNSDGIIFVKSHLSRLPGYQKATAEVAARKLEEENFTERKTPEEQYQNQPIPESPPEDALAQAGFDATSFIAAKGQQRRDSVIKLEDIPPVNYLPTDSNPIAIFEQTCKSRDNTHFVFTGWHNITNISLIAPRSNELVRMLEQKWSTGVESKRDMTAWARSLGYEWAVIKMSKIVGDDAPEPPKVQQTPKRSVNELLAELRMGSTGSGVDGEGSSGKENSTTKQRNQTVDEETFREGLTALAVEQK